jgi:hypothetical protein
MLVPPKVFWILTTYWRIPRTLSRRLWSALDRAKWSVPVALRQVLLLYSVAVVGDRRALIDETCSPLAIIDVIEALVHERQLTRRQATALEEAILARVSAQGTWR